MRVLLLLVCLGMWLAPTTAGAFTVHKKAGSLPGPTLLVVGGIQGDEPGGFNAANLLVTHYEISRGELWVAPNFNFHSIIARSRGIHGDMNRKFARLSPNDPEFEAVTEMKRLITDPQVDAVLNLHDGSGFYREDHIDRLHNPSRWGQSLIIDQPRLAGSRFGELDNLARRVAGHINGNLVEGRHRFSVKDTRTRWGDAEMAKTLTFFAIEHGKAAFGIEASKSFNTALRVYYHLLAIEGYLREVGIEFRRRFPLSPDGVEQAIGSHPLIALYGNKVVLDVADAREELGYVPLKKEGVEFRSTSPLVALVERGPVYQVCYGNRRLTRLHPQFFEYDDSLERVTLEVDGETVEVDIGTIVPVRERFAVQPTEGYRVNLIGYTRAGPGDESGMEVRRGDFLQRYSVDRGGQMFRVEIYRGERFSGMVLADFSARRDGSEQRWWYSGRAMALHDASADPDAGELGR